MVESKIYREDELETEIAKLKAAGDRSDSRSTASTARSRQASVSAQGAAADEEECEMCGELGHQLDDCPVCTSEKRCVAARVWVLTPLSPCSVVAGSAGSPIKPHHSPLPDTPSMNGTAEYCDDCEVGSSLGPLARRKADKSPRADVRTQSRELHTIVRDLLVGLQHVLAVSLDTLRISLRTFFSAFSLSLFRHLPLEFICSTFVYSYIESC